MARPRFLRRDAAPRLAAVPPPPAGVLRRERRVLQKLRRERLCDLGGLLLEMYRRGNFREELLSEQCADLVAIETRLAEIQLSLAGPPRRAPRCACGATLLPGARFCAGCGRPLAPASGSPGEETMIEPPPEGGAA